MPENSPPDSASTTVPARPLPPLADIEQPPGEPLVAPLPPGPVDQARERVYQSYEQFLRQGALDEDQLRPGRWQRDYSSLGAYLASIAPMRQRFAAMLGFWSEPSRRGPLIVTDQELLRDGSDYQIRRVFFEVCPGLETYAIELCPKSPGPHPALLAQHGYLGTPEMVCGLTKSANGADYAYRSLGLRAVRRGYHVLAPHHPSGFGSDSDAVDKPLPGFANQSVHYGKNRLHRLALLQGGTLLGLDMLTSSRGLDLLLSRPEIAAEQVGLYGLSRGGQAALYLPALDQRIRASVCAAYFNERLPKLIGPCATVCFLDWFAEGQFLPNQLGWFSDADVVSLIAPRAFAVEAGAKDTAVDQQAAWREFQRAQEHHQRLGLSERTAFIAHGQGHISATAAAFAFLARQLPLARA